MPRTRQPLQLPGIPRTVLNVLYTAHSQIKDLDNGYPERELTEPLAKTLADLKRILKRYDPNYDATEL